MTARHLLIAAALGSFGIQWIAAPPAAAQSTTTGAIQGKVTDADTGEALAGVTVVVTSPVLQGTQTAISDENGLYKVAELPPGDYLVTFYINQLTVQRPDIKVGLDKTTPVFQKIKLSQAAGEIVRIHDTPPSIDPTSTTQGITIDKSYLKNMPVPGRTFESALGAAAGSQNDGLGVAFSGSSSLENQYIVDGLNTTGLTFGTVGSPVINDFIEEIEVVTGGYNAEYGRATGGVVNVVTKTGSNEFKGSIFGTFQPGFLTAPAERTPINASSIDATGNNAYIADIGFELGGPIIRDRLWFFVGFAPQFSRTDITRTTKRQTDCRKLLPSGALSACDPRDPIAGGNADNKPDVDPATGFFITDTLDEEVRSDTVQAYNVLGKLNFAATPENQLQLSFQALPRFSHSPQIFGLENSGVDASGLVADIATKWTSKLNDNKTEIEAVVGVHYDHVGTSALDPSVADQPLQILTNGNLGTWAPGFGGESGATIAGCADNAMGDPYPHITNCPMTAKAYLVGGPGPMANDTEQRLTAAASLTQRVKLLGNHEIKGGADVESDTADKARLFSGGALLTNFVGQRVRVNRWVQLEGTGQMDPRFNEMCSTPDTSGTSTNPKTVSFACDFLGGAEGDPGTQITSNTFNWAAYLRDSWQILPNLTVNAGVRYEEQRLRYASFLQHTTDPLTQVPLGKNAMTLQNMWAPRVGAIYDWTQEGRSKIYAHWGRFYESIPLDINARSFGGEVQLIQDYANCGMGVDQKIGGSNGNDCLTSPRAVLSQEQLLGASGVLIAPGIQPQYLDEFVAGVEYEVIDDLKVGLSVQSRVLGRVIEDVSPDGANTYIIANPGEWSAAEEAKLMDQIARTDDMATKARLTKQLSLYQGIRIFDKPRRDYNAIQLTVARRFTGSLYLQGSYTYSRVTGNYPGLISYDNGQVDPNISSQYDLIELLANREGLLPQDRPHYVKLDGHYTFDLHKQGALTLGARVRLYSGTPENALGAHYIYGANESFLLPRGALGRSDFDHGVDLRVAYTRPLGRDMALTVYADIFNVYDHQGTAAIDTTYAPAVNLQGQLQNANPISGGSYEDLIWLKQVDDKGNEKNQPIGRNPNFGNTIQRYGPTNGRIGATLTF
ncbi:MAG TPA: TonB-dependent receptor [Kofleriaceae bacterium]|jgi:outer membrane receptor protein involved in Fe transport